MICRSPESCLPEISNPVKIGIFDEAQLLKTVAVWGAVGAEAVLTQCYPETTSLFFDSFDVVTAREEGLKFTGILQEHGIQVLMIRDLLANALKPRLLQKDAVISSMIKKAETTQSQYSTNVRAYGNLIVELVERDIDRYGEDKALTLNKTLSIDPLLPLGNSLYGRDQMNVLLDTRVVSRMAKDIRRREVSLYELVYRGSLAPHDTISIPIGETFEGGDAYIHNGSVFVGVGTRTTLKAAIEIYGDLRPQLDQCGLKFAVVEDEGACSRSFAEQQDSMHLDTFSNPIGKKEIAVCLEEARRRKIRFLTGNNGDILLTDGQSFIDYLEKTEDNIVVIPKEEQQGFGCNFLLKGEEPNGKYTIFVPLRTNTETNNQLQKLGKEVIFTDLSESTKGYGAAHCMTGQLVRENYEQR